jgi:hypothetical protein
MGFKFALQQDEKKKKKSRKKPAPVRGLPTAPRINPFDVDVAKEDFEIYRQKIAQMKVDASAFNVVDNNTNDLAVTMMGQARRLSKLITGLKDAKLKPHNQFRTQLIAFTKAFSSPLEDVVKTLKGKTENFAYQEILKQRAREKLEREAAVERQRKLDAEAESAGVETVTIPQVPVDQEQKVQTRTETGSSLSIKLEWQGLVIDEGAVPREYCIPDQKKINKAILAGVREIPGVEIKEVPKSRLLA